MTKIAGSGSISQRHRSADPDPAPPQNVMDPQHCQEGRLGGTHLFFHARDSLFKLSFFQRRRLEPTISFVLRGNLRLLQLGSLGRHVVRRRLSYIPDDPTITNMMKCRQHSCLRDLLTDLPRRRFVDIPYFPRGGILAPNFSKESISPSPASSSPRELPV
jgi:hypothetical protein